MTTEGKVCVSVAIALLLLEGAVRLLEPYLSRDVEEMLARSSLPDQLEERKKAGDFTVLVVGNSLAKANLHEETFEAELSAKGCRNPAVFFLTADGTNINEWAASYRKYFPDGETKPDLLVWVTGPGHLLDQPPASPERLAAYHTALADAPRVPTEWLPDTNLRARFLLARFSRLFAFRERVRPLLFYNFVPGFENTSEAINRHEKSKQKDSGGGSGQASRFQYSVTSSGLSAHQMVVVAAALPFPYEIPDSVKEVANAHGVLLLERGAEAGWSSEDFPDGYHLSEERSVDFTRETVAQLPLP